MSTASSFLVALSDGSTAPAGISADPSAESVALAREAFRFQVAGATELQPPTGRYNCHGLVFASRRGHIPPVDADVDIDEVLRRDGYRSLADSEEPQVGDIIAYRLDDEIEHTGFVSRVERLGGGARRLRVELVGWFGRVRTSAASESLQGHP